MVPFPQRKSRELGPYAWGVQKRVKMPKISPEQGGRGRLAPAVQAAQGGQQLALPVTPGSSEGLASILGSGWWERQAEAKCPEAGQFWWNEVEEGEVAG